MFTNSITTAEDLTNATWEIMIMLLVTFLLGWLFGYLWHKNDYNQDVDSNEALQRFKNTKNDDLKIIEGIGPKIEHLLKDNGVKNMSQLAESKIENLKKILTNGGDRFQMHDPSSWSDQAYLANKGLWNDLTKYQDLLIGGRK